MRATTGSNILIVMASRWSAMPRLPPIPHTARGYLLLCVLRECFATNSQIIPIGKRQDIITQSSISGVFTHAIRWRDGSVPSFKILRQKQQYRGREQCP